MKKALVLFFILWFGLSLVSAQPDFYKNYSFTAKDTLRGMLRPERTCYDVRYYHLQVNVDPAKKFIEGYVDIYFDALENFKTLQIDLYADMKIHRVVHYGEELAFSRSFDAVFVDLPAQEKGTSSSFRVYYSGSPRTAINPPWDGGFVWTTDDNGNPWIGVACEGDGASLWWPNKDHLSDEPDSMTISVAVPKGLTCVANGNLRKKTTEGDFDRFEWAVTYPVNNYNITVNIGKYAHFTEEYTAGDGSRLLLDYYVLAYNEQKARRHFQQVPKVLACFERYFGKYPFWNDGFALVETPYLGMEHQSAIAYGNRYMRGYLGGMIPRDMNWDYIIVHETGHEYFGNSISIGDMSEMWIHESFTTYMEALYVECAYSYPDAIRYLASQRSFLLNREPILGPKDVNWDDWDGSDHYFKGAWVLHTLRHAIYDDAKWFDLLRGFYEKYALSVVTSDDFFRYVNQCLGTDYSAFFEQYLTYPDIPTLVYQLKQKKDGLEVRFRWEADVSSFRMPVLIGKKDDYQQVFPTTREWKTVLLKGVNEKEFRVATELFLIKEKKQTR